MSRPPEHRPAWHTLLAPLPPEAVPVRKDGRVIGTCWTVTGPEPLEDEPPAWESTPRPPTDEEIAVLKRLVAEIVLRAG